MPANDARNHERERSTPAPRQRAQVFLQFLFDALTSGGPLRFVDRVDLREETLIERLGQRDSRRGLPQGAIEKFEFGELLLTALAASQVRLELGAVRWRRRRRRASPATGRSREASVPVQAS